MKCLLRLLLLTPALAIPVAAHADTVNFYLSGTLQSGGTATGLITVNRTAGYVNPVDITVKADGSTFNFIGSFFEGPYTGISPLEFYSVSYDNGGDKLLLSFPTLLTGYNGGALCSTTTVCQGFTSSFTNYTGAAKPSTDYFTTLSASPVPEPGSLPFVLTGLLAVAGAVRRRLP